MRRRDFIAGLGSAAAWPLPVRAQQRALPVIGYLGAGTLEGSREALKGFHGGLSEIGYVEGKNLAVEYRWALRIDSTGYPPWPPISFAGKCP